MIGVFLLWSCPTSCRCSDFLWPWGNSPDVWKEWHKVPQTHHEAVLSLWRTDGRHSVPHLILFSGSSSSKLCRRESCRVPAHPSCRGQGWHFLQRVRTHGAWRVQVLYGGSVAHEDRPCPSIASCWSMKWHYRKRWARCLSPDVLLPIRSRSFPTHQ